MSKFLLFSCLVVAVICSFFTIPAFANHQEIMEFDQRILQQNSIIYHDFDNDGLVDILYFQNFRRPTGDEVYWVQNLGGTFAEPMKILTGKNFIFAVDLDKDGLLDFITQEPKEDTLYHVNWYRNNDNGFDPPQEILLFTSELYQSPSIHQFTDFDNDGDIDMTMFYHDPNTKPIRYFWYENIDLKFHRRETLFTKNMGHYDITMLDMDNHGSDDWLYTAVINDTGWICWSKKDSTQLSAPQPFNRFTFNYWNVADINGDGHKDIMARFYHNERWVEWDDYIFINNNDGTFMPLENPFLPPRFRYMLDLDNDNDDDVLDIFTQTTYDTVTFIPTYTSSITLYENTGDGQFVQMDTIFYMDETLIKDPQFIDIDGDSNIDLVFAIESSADLYLKLVWLPFTIISGIEDQEPTSPQSFALMPNYPNPFNPETRINFTIPKATEVNLTVYNLQGQRIETIYNRFAAAGNHSVTWNAANRPSGTYFIRMQAGEFNQVQKCILLK